MTIGAICCIVFGAIIAIVGVILGAVIISEGDNGPGIGTIIVAIVLALLFIVSPIIYMNTETGQRALKDQESNFNGGISRTVTVYDVNGQVLEQYSGTFDIETNNTDYIIFDDENNKRHMIFYKTGTITVNEN